MPRRVLLYLACGVLTAGPAIGAFASTSTPSPAGATAAGTPTQSAAPQPPAPDTRPAAHRAAASERTQPRSSARTASSPRAADATSTATTPAPPAHADAAALLIGGLLGIGHTSADAGPTSSAATANAIELGGNPLIPGTTGGTQSGNGTSKGALLDTGATPLGQLMLAPWQASSSSSNGTSSADADAALARLYVVDPKTLDVSVLQSTSHARYDGSGSSGSASSDGAVVNLGDGALTVDLLHAESASGSTGSSYLLGINGNDIGTSQQANGGCVLTLPQVLSLSCLTASGGPAATTASSAVGALTVGTGQVTGEVVGTKSAGAHAPAATNANSGPRSGQRNDQTRVQGEKLRHTSASSLPFTGAELTSLFGVAAVVLAGGAWLQQIARRRDGVPTG